MFYASTKQVLFFFNITELSFICLSAKCLLPTWGGRQTRVTGFKENKETLTVQHTNDKINSPVLLEHFAVNWLEGKFTNVITDDKEGTAIFSRCCRESNL